MRNEYTYIYLMKKDKKSRNFIKLKLKEIVYYDLWKSLSNKL